jgi:hypothetical protein
MLWIKVRNFNLWSRVIDFGVGTQHNVFFALSVDNTGIPSLAVLSDTICVGEVQSSVPLGLGYWIHLTGVFNFPNAYIYINGYVYVNTVTAISSCPGYVMRQTNFIGRSNWYHYQFNLN